VRLWHSRAGALLARSRENPAISGENVFYFFKGYRIAISNVGVANVIRSCTIGRLKGIVS
jgi:hypothetical protein